MSNMCCLAEIVIFLVVTGRYQVVTAGYCSIPGGYCLLLVVTAQYCLLLLVPTLSLNGNFTNLGRCLNFGCPVQGSLIFAISFQIKSILLGILFSFK